MIVNYDGTEYDLDLEDMDTDEARTMERFGIKDLESLENGVGRGDIDALQAVYWLMLIQGGQTARIDRVKFKPVKLLRALAKATKNERDKAEAEGKDEAPKED